MRVFIDLDDSATASLHWMTRKNPIKILKFSSFIELFNVKLNLSLLSVLQSSVRGCLWWKHLFLFRTFTFSPTERETRSIKIYNKQASKHIRERPISSLRVIKAYLNDASYSHFFLSSISSLSKCDDCVARLLNAMKHLWRFPIILFFRPFIFTIK